MDADFLKVIDTNQRTVMMPNTRFAVERLMERSLGITDTKQFSAKSPDVYIYASRSARSFQKLMLVACKGKFDSKG